jgi:hypothetical protein
MTRATTRARGTATIGRNHYEAHVIGPLGGSRDGLPLRGTPLLGRVFETRPRFTWLLALAVCASAVLTLHQGIVGRPGYAALGAAATVVWTALFVPRFRASVRVDQQLVTISGQHQTRMRRADIAQVSVLRASRVGFDVTVATKQHVVTRIATGVSKERADQLAAVLRDRTFGERNYGALNLP